MITKAIIPVAGWGTRRLPITKIIEKSMLPVGNRPLVDYSVQDLIKAGVKDIYMVVSNVEPCQVRAFYRDNLALNLYLRERGKEDKLKKANTIPDDVTIHYVAQDPSAKYALYVSVVTYKPASKSASSTALTNAVTTANFSSAVNAYKLASSNSI